MKRHARWELPLVLIDHRRQQYSDQPWLPAITLAVAVIPANTHSLEEWFSIRPVASLG